MTFNMNPFCGTGLSLWKCTEARQKKLATVLRSERNHLIGSAGSQKLVALRCPFVERTKPHHGEKEHFPIISVCHQLNVREHSKDFTGESGWIYWPARLMYWSIPILAPLFPILALMNTPIPLPIAIGWMVSAGALLLLVSLFIREMAFLRALGSTKRDLESAKIALGEQRRFLELQDQQETFPEDLVKEAYAIFDQESQMVDELLAITDHSLASSRWLLAAYGIASGLVLLVGLLVVLEFGLLYVGIAGGLLLAPLLIYIRGRIISMGLLEESKIELLNKSALKALTDWQDFEQLCEP